MDENEMEDTIERLECEIADLEGVIADLENELNQANIEIDHLEGELTDLTSDDLPDALLDFYKAIKRGDTGTPETMYVEDALRAKGMDTI